MDILFLLLILFSIPCLIYLGWVFIFFIDKSDSDMLFLISKFAIVILVLIAYILKQILKISDLYVALLVVIPFCIGTI